MQLSSLLVTLVRHGESQDNVQSIWAGFRDTPLSSNGVKQAMALGQAFSNVPLTAIYSSDLRRAAMTAEEILKANRSIPPPPLVQSKSLREQNFGQAEGQSWAAAEWTAHSQGDDARNFRFQDGESLEDVNSRMAKAVRQFVLPRVETLRRQGPTILSSSSNSAEIPHICIVAHGLAIAELLRVFMSLHEQHLDSPWSDPRQTYKRVRLENTGWTRLELSVPVGSSVGGRPSPHPSTSSAAAMQLLGTRNATEARADSGEQSNASGETLSEVGKGLSESTTARPPPSISEGQKPTFVRILCQNQIEHLRAFAMQPSSISGGSAAHTLGGGIASNIAASANATATGNPSLNTLVQSTNGAASNAGTGVANLPSSATLASIASNATLSSSASNATLPPPSTPATGTGAAGTRTATATPASARSLNAYDVKMMARELERAGVASMLAGTENHGGAGGGGGGSSSSIAGGPLSHPAGGHAVSSAGTSNQSGAVSGAGSGGSGATAGPGSDRPVLPTSSSSLSTLHSLGTGQAPPSRSQLFGPYTSGGGLSGSGAPAGSPNVAAAGFLNASGATSDVWQSICVRLLPLFNGDGLRTSIEDINDLVSQHVRRTLDRGPARALDALSSDLHSLVASGTLTLNSKLMGLEDVRLLVRLAEIWTFFLGQVLPYIQGCFLPFQTDSLLQSLTTSLRSIHAAAAQSAVSPNLGSALRTEKINVRRILLVVFRDHVVLPIYERLAYLFAHISEVDPACCSGEEGAAGASAGEGSKQVYLRLLQMTSILASVVSDDEAQAALDGLVRALRMGSKAAAAKGKEDRGGSDFDGLGMRTGSPIQNRLSNRRGWMAQKARKHGVGSLSGSLSLSSMLGGGSGTGGSTMMSTTHAVRSMPATTINRFGQEVTEGDYLSALRSPTLSSDPSTPGQLPPPTPPSKDDLAGRFDPSVPRRSEDSSHTAAPRSRDAHGGPMYQDRDRDRRRSDDGSWDDRLGVGASSSTDAAIANGLGLRRGMTQGNGDGPGAGNVSSDNNDDGHGHDEAASQASGESEGGEETTPVMEKFDRKQHQQYPRQQPLRHGPGSGTAATTISGGAAASSSLSTGDQSGDAARSQGESE